MLDFLDKLQNEIAHERGKLDRWLDASYAGLEDHRYSGARDCVYPYWEGIYSVAGTVFDRKLTSKLSKVSIDSLLFFISRNDERSNIITWLSSGVGQPFSRCGNLSYPALLFLSEQASLRSDDFCDYHLAASFIKCESLDDRAIKILLKLFQKNDSYTRRTVLQAFENFALPQTVELATALWNSDDCEFAKLSCLSALKAIPAAKLLFETWLEEYQNTYNMEAEEYRLSHIRRLTAEDT